MHDVIHIAIAQVQAAWRWRWYGLGVAWLVCLASWIIIEKIPDRYVSSAQVHIDTDSMLGPLMSGIAANTGTSIQTRLNLVRRTLLSRPNLEQLMRMTDLDIAAISPAEKEYILASLKSRLKISLGGRGSSASLFQVSFVDHDPALAQKIVQSLLTIFVETNLGANREDLARTQRFLDGQLLETYQNLDEAERRLVSFRMENRGLLPGVGNVQGDLETAKTRLVELRAQFDEEIRIRDDLKVELAKASDGTQQRGESLSVTAQRIAALDAEIEDLLLRYTESHPDVILSKKLRQRLIESQDRAVETPEDQNGATGSDTSEVVTPRMALLRTQLNEHDVRIASLNRQIAQLEAKIERLIAAIQKIPEVTAAQQQIERKISLLKSSYEALRQRREATRFTEELDTKTERVQFRVVEPPNLPATPDGPDRQLFNFGGLLGGVGSGLVFAVMLSFLLPTFGSPESLAQHFQRPVLGVITTIPQQSKRWLRTAESLGFVSVFGGLIGVFFIALSGIASNIINQSFQGWQI
jgi:polysaccharide chain length determinant protein (PEP-CTERM system associated)